MANVKNLQDESEKNKAIKVLLRTVSEEQEFPWNWEKALDFVKRVEKELNVTLERSDRVDLLKHLIQL